MIPLVHSSVTERSKDKQIVLLIPSLLGGGAERVMIALANDLNEKGYLVNLVSINSEIPSYPIEKGVITINLVKRESNSIIYRLYYIVQIVYKLVRLLRNTKPICMISFITSANIFTGIACWITNTSYIVSERTSPNRSSDKINIIQKWIASQVYKRAKAVVVGSLGGERCLLENKNFGILHNIHKIPNSVPEFGALSKQAVHHKKFVLGVGRLSFVKGFDILINAFSTAAVEDLDLLIVGEGEERENLNNLIHKLGLNNRVHLIGAKTNVQDYYSQAEIFVLPSRNEGYPNALVEAMNFGCPSIAANCEFGPSEIINDGISGLLVEPEDYKAMATMILMLHQTPDLREKLSLQASTIRSTNDANTIFKKWEDLAVL